MGDSTEIYEATKQPQMDHSFDTFAGSPGLRTFSVQLTSPCVPRTSDNDCVLLTLFVESVAEEITTEMLKKKKTKNKTSMSFLKQ